MKKKDHGGLVGEKGYCCKRGMGELGFFFFLSAGIEAD